MQVEVFVSSLLCLTRFEYCNICIWNFLALFCSCSKTFCTKIRSEGKAVGPLNVNFANYSYLISFLDSTTSLYKTHLFACKYSP